MDMEQLLSDLPDDTGAALFELLQRIERGLKANDPIGYMNRCSVIQAYYDACSLDAPKAVSASIASEQEKLETIWERRYVAFRADILRQKHVEDAGKAKSLLASKVKHSFGFAILNKEEKTLIHKHIEKIRTIVESSALDEKKKNAIFTKLAALGAETDRIGTRTDTFFGFFGDLACTVGGMAEKAKPAVHEAKEILKIVMRSRAAQEQVTLPSSDDFPLIMPD